MQREIVIGSRSVEHYFYFVIKELITHHRVIIKARNTTDNPESVINTQFGELLRKITLGKIKQFREENSHVQLFAEE